MFPLILKLLPQITSIFSAKYFCRRNESPKAFFNRFSKLPTDLRTYSQHHDVVATAYRLNGGSSHKKERFWSDMAMPTSTEGASL